MSRWARVTFIGSAIVLAGVGPYYLSAFWLQLGIIVAASVIATLGLILIVGFAGQLTFALPFFMAIGAYTYAWLATSSDATVPGMNWPSLLSLVAAVIGAGLVGGLFSPVSARLRTLYLGVASLGLVFIGQYILIAAVPFSGGFIGRTIPPLNLFGLELSDRAGLMVAGVPFGRLGLLWIFAMLLVLCVFIVTRRGSESRAGLEYRIVRENEQAAAALGIDVTRIKTRIFVISSMYAGLGGALLAIGLQRVVPENFGLQLSINTFVMIVIGGMRSVYGPLLGAPFVVALPLVLQQYAPHLPFIAAPGSGGVDPTTLANLVYGFLVVVLLVVTPRGVAGLFVLVGEHFGNGKIGTSEGERYE